MPYVPTCFACLRALMPMCHACLCAHVPACLACLCAHVPTCLACLRAHVSSCIACLRVRMPMCLACFCSRASAPCVHFVPMVSLHLCDCSFFLFPVKWNCCTFLYCSYHCSCTANQLTGFYVRATLALNELSS